MEMGDHDAFPLSCIVGGVELTQSAGECPGGLVEASRSLAEMSVEDWLMGDYGIGSVETGDAAG